jgi:peptide/nickel transport system permease protein
VNRKPNTRRVLKRAAAALLGMLYLACIPAGLLAPAAYDAQHRESFSAPPSNEFILGTDDLGRDRFSRLLHGARISLLLGPAAALLSTGLAAGLGIMAATAWPWMRRCLNAGIELTLSLPWLFLLLTVRAVLPLNVSSYASVAITFLLLGSLGWAAAARVVRAGMQGLANSEFILLARAQGCSPYAILRVHVLPNLRPILWAQFLVSVPLFILSEANLGILGLGVAEPLPSLGTLLRELENFHAVAANPAMLAPALLLLAAVSCFQILTLQEDSAS